MDTNKMREQFETWALSAKAHGEHFDLSRGNHGAYRSLITHWLYCSWVASYQASREAVVVELPSACAYEGLTQHLGSVIELTYEAPEHDPVGLARIPDVRSAIEAQGLRVKP